VKKSTIQIDAAVHERLKAIAQRTGYKISNMTSEVLNSWAKKVEIEEEK